MNISWKKTFLISFISTLSISLALFVYSIFISQQVIAFSLPSGSIILLNIGLAIANIYLFENVIKINLSNSVQKILKYLFLLSVALMIFAKVYFQHYQVASNLEPFILLILMLIAFLCLLTISFIYKKPIKIEPEGNDFKDVEKNKSSLFKNKRIMNILVVVIIALYFIFGTVHLGQFMSVDEPKWLLTRVPQLYEAISHGNWADTYINDKPGVLPSLLSGIVNFFTSYNRFDFSNREVYLAFWRMPIIIFNASLLVLIYMFSKKIFSKGQSILILAFIALNPIIIGISQIVNPDATLWSTSFLSFLCFLIYLRNHERKYILYSALFFSLALISKYFVSIYYVIFSLIILLEFMFNKKSEIDLFYARIYEYLKFILLSVFLFGVMFPATWVQPLYLLNGSIDSSILSSGITYIYLLIFVIFFDAFILNFRLINLVKRCISQKNAGMLLSIAFLVLFVIVNFNFMLNQKILNINNYYFGEYEIRNFEPLKLFLSSITTIILTLTLPLLLGVFLNIFIFLRKSVDKRLEFYSIIIQFCVLTFIVGASIGGFYANPRYQIMLYPLAAIMAMIFICQIDFRFKIVKYIIIGAYLIAINLLSLPFYNQYSNILNSQKIITAEAWGYGGYEVAQYMNKKENSDSILSWADREGFKEFFKGESDIRYEASPVSKKYDYYILTNGGKRIFYINYVNLLEGDSNKYGKMAIESDIFSLYDKNSEYRFCLNRDFNCITVIRK
ncbi:MAG: glycosyltransferase family 39 protein [Patescibacteria group bacterium]|jgi:4-amino-4-deoxy-L-arabinose transferase-like glycosyltransferase